MHVASSGHPTLRCFHFIKIGNRDQHSEFWTLRSPPLCGCYYCIFLLLLRWYGLSISWQREKHFNDEQSFTLKWLCLISFEPPTNAQATFISTGSQQKEQLRYKISKLCRRIIWCWWRQEGIEFMHFGKIYDVRRKWTVPESYLLRIMTEEVAAGWSFISGGVAQ